jgi:hypothetical protein
VEGPGFEEVDLPLEHPPLWVRAGSAIVLTDPGGASTPVAMAASQLS